MLSLFCRGKRILVKKQQEESKIQLKIQEFLKSSAAEISARTIFFEKYRGIIWKHRRWWMKIKIAAENSTKIIS